MINSEHDAQSDEAALTPIVAGGARGALTVVAIATAIVVAVWLAFYLFVFLPRVAP